MSHDEFIATVSKVFDEDSHYNNSATRTFTAAEMATFLDHIWAMFAAQGSVDFTSPSFIKALIRSRRYHSAQEQAEALPRLIATELAAEKNPPPIPKVP